MLTGPNIAWTIDELNAQDYYLKKAVYPGAKILAENLGDNHFRFVTRNVRKFLFRLHPAMADLSKPVRAEIDGKTHEFRPEPDLSHPDYTAKITAAC